MINAFKKYDDHFIIEDVNGNKFNDHLRNNKYQHFKISNNNHTKGNIKTIAEEKIERVEQFVIKFFLMELVEGETMGRGNKKTVMNSCTMVW